MALTKITSNVVKDDAVTSAKIVDGGIATADIADNAVTSTKIAQNSILTKHIDDGQVTTDQLGADAVTSAKIADDAISEEHLDVTVITSLSEVTAATGDLLMIADISDSNNLKKIPVSSIQAGRLALTGGTITGTVVFNSAPTFNTAITMNSSLNVATTVGIAGTTVIDSSRNLTNIGTISSGAISTSSSVAVTGAAGAAISEGLLVDWSTNLARFLTYDSSTGSEIAFYTQPSGGSTTQALRLNSSQNATFAGNITTAYTIDAGAYALGSTVVINSNRDLTNIGTISSGAITSSGDITLADNLKATGNNLKLWAGGNHIINIDLNGNLYPQTHNAVDLGFSDSLAFRNLHLVGAITGGATISSGTITTTGITSTGTITLPGSTAGVRTIKDSYASGALANQGFLRSSGGNYWAYSAYQDGSANWKSAVSVASERSVYAMDEDKAYWSHAPSQTVSIGSDLTTQPVEKIRFDLENGRVGIGIQNPAYALHVNSKLAVGDSPASGLSGNTIHVRENSSSGIHFPLVIGGGTHTAGTAFGIGLDPEGYGNRNKIAILAEGIGAGYSRGRLHFALDSVDDSGQVTLADSKMCILENGNIGIGSQLDNAGHKLHVWGGNAHTNLAVTTNDGYKSEVRMMEDKAGTQHGGYIRYDGNGDYTQIGTYNSGSDTTAISIDDSGNVGLGVTNPAGHFEVHSGRMGIISTSSSWEQLRVANSSVAEAGIAIMNGCTASEFLADDSPSFSNAFTLAINPYGCGTDTLAVAHGNLGDSIWHIDGSGNFGYGPNTENPISYYEISKTRPNVNAPSDYELKMTLNTYGYVGGGYKLAMLQWLGGDTASAQDNFYAGIGSTALDGANNSEEGSLDFHVRNGVSTTETLAMQIIGKAGTGIAGGGQHVKSVLFPYQGIAIDRVWNSYPGISVLNSSDAGTNQGEFRFHGTNSSSAAYPGTSGADFSVNVRTDGSFISTSDRRAKTNITAIDNALATVKQLTGKRFQRINRQNDPQEQLSKNGYKFGFIAQEVEDIIPEAVIYHEDEDDGTEGWNSAYAMDNSSVVALLVNAIKEQDVVIQDLKSRIETLEG